MFKRVGSSVISGRLKSWSELLRGLNELSDGQFSSLSSFLVFFSTNGLIINLHRTTLIRLRNAGFQLLWANRWSFTLSFLFYIFFYPKEAHHYGHLIWMMRCFFLRFKYMGRYTTYCTIMWDTLFHGMDVEKWRRINDEVETSII